MQVTCALQITTINQNTAQHNSSFTYQVPRHTGLQPACTFPGCEQACVCVCVCVYLCVWVCVCVCVGVWV